ncbi:hypothetical protein HYZ76_00975 [Candidatus Falkowbacteria bacterium]|nr:hypothetical protein [Candidatus Falkowbacteria bacterium]
MVEPGGQFNKVSPFRLRASYWYVSHKLRLKQGLVVFLILLSITLYSYSLYKVLLILVVQNQSFKQDLLQLSSNPINYSYFHQVNQPRDLRIVSFDALDGSDGRYDFIAKIENPNPKWFAAEVLLQLISGSEIISEKRSFIHPGEQKYVAFFGQELENFVNPVLRIADVSWRRTQDFAQYAEPRLKFSVSDIDFKSAQQSGVRGELPVSILSFKIRNDSAFSYWQVGVYMALTSDQRVGAANYISLDQFVSGQTREVEMRWYEALPPVGSIEILPEVNILDESVYMRVR